MKILIIGSEEGKAELIKRLPETADISHLTDPEPEILKSPDRFDLIFDLESDQRPETLKNYASLEGTTVFAGAARNALAGMASSVEMACTLFGMNTLPTFLDRDYMEVSMVNEADTGALEQVSKALEWPVLTVSDRVGMVTPRVILMIINEACYTLQEGTAGIEDIDLAMQLGTNYPGGPFMWADKIGLTNVYETLKAIYDDTLDERYKICPLLKTKYLKGESFYPASGR